MYKYFARHQLEVVCYPTITITWECSFVCGEYMVYLEI